MFFCRKYPGDFLKSPGCFDFYALLMSIKFIFSQLKDNIDILFMLWSIIITHLLGKGGCNMKLYGYRGKSNISGLRIRQARVERKFSQEDLAKKLQLIGLYITQKTISNIENGNRIVPDYELQFYAKVLQVGILWLLGMTDDKS